MGKKNISSLEILFDRFKHNPQFAHFDRTEKAQFIQTIQPQQSEAKRMMSILGKQEFTNVLDIGCSTGNLSRALSPYSSHVYGVDPEAEAIELSKAVAEYYGDKKVTFLVGSNEALPFEDSTFDLVVSKTVIEHVSSITDSIAETKRVLSDGGIAYIEAPNYFWFFESHYKLPFFPLMPRFLFKCMCLTLRRDIEFIGHINFVNPWQIEAIFKANGLEYENVYLQKLWNILVKADPPKSVFYSWLAPVAYVLSVTRMGHLIYYVMKNTGIYPTMAYVVKKKGTKE